MHLQTMLQATRPPFLVLSPVCVFLGTSTAIANGGNIDTTALLLVILAALCAHISVNTLNEYHDFKTGLDFLTTKTPFSGGSGALPQNPAVAGMVLAVGLTALLLTTSIGIYFIVNSGPLLLVMGVVGIVIILTYTQWINRWPLLCLIAPGLGFGVLMVVGTHLVLAGEASNAAWLASLVPFFLVNNLLLLNQYPDIDADRSIGRKHLPIAHGTTISSYIYGLFSLAACTTVLAGVYYGYFPSLGTVALLPAGLSLYSFRGALRHGEKIGAYPHYLATNVAATLLTPLVLGIAILYG
ncbi:MAG: prenyltransferase [Gammaproteobacteria bacterium]|jgi:1,4-dihydroxy-2-naphthoate octaprenyltransferase